MKARYEKYKRTMTANQIQTLFNHHRLSSWFGERYDPSPEFVKLRARVRKQGWQGREAKFIADLEEGKYDTLAAIATDSGAVHTGPEDDLSAQAAEENQDGEEQEEHTMDQDNANENEAANADAEANGSAPATGGDASRPRAGDISVMPEGNQVMIRTIPPDIGRLKLEEACSTVPGFVHLALGDPMQKRNYYRAGWIKFDDDANMSEAVRLLGEKKIEGFKLHVTHSTRPFISRLRSTPEIASRPDRVEKDLANVKKLAAILEDEALILNRKDENSSIETEGEEAKPPHVEHTELPKERGSEAVERRLERLVAELQEQHHEGEENGLTVKKSVIALDLYLAYLRYAFNCCYYCAAVTDHVEELQRKCIKHVRKPLSGADSSKDERWVDWLDQKIALLIDKNGVDPRDYGGKNYDEELAKAVEPHVKQEDEGKFRCKTCNKLFKATTFVEKHIANKHPELVKQLDDLPFFNNFALDPHRIQPFIHPPPPSGGGQHPPPQAYGLHGSSRNADSYPRHANQYPSSYAPHYSGYGQSSYYDHSYPGYGQAYGYPPHNSYYERRRSPPRRLAERMGDLSAPVSDPMHSQLTIRAGIEGLPAKPVSNAILEPGPGGRRGGRGPGGSSLTAGPLPPPPDAKEDPRAAAGRKISYHDMDEVAEGDIELTY
ncbi:hypothetical protein BOTBODRAFT_139690 [Botryobasidium botryosum FD-172 SS1]|uniref:C2H2-type domain-containing protein n=1 Tax=Botryobasidium botryosum (strain FD-172 SS1) TaxID=930990 RepID=A0A067M860_BOTB1|nr:hypothetical protein BOTBODRAFT_139690 [Botryobasidium botryosum FD-172 SS1]